MSQITDQTILDNSKGLEVPDFNKKEIEGIAVESVKKEIAAGGIPVGTKLYRHTISAGSGKNVIFLSKSNTPYTTSTISAATFKDVIDLKLSGATEGIGISLGGGSARFASYSPPNLTTSSVNLQSDLVSDTVEEL